MMPNSIQPREYSKGGVPDGILRKFGSVWVHPNGNRNVVYLTSDGRKRNLNLNWNDNDWTGVCRFLAFRQCFISPLLIRGSFCFK